MASPLKCDLCGTPATVHLTQIVNGKMHKVDLCEACAQAKGVTDPGGFSLADLLLKASLNPENTESPAGVVTAGGACPSCGFTPADFKKHGRFGCSQCYRTFEGMVGPMLDTMHKGTRHVGKVPVKALERRNLIERLNELERGLAAAIKSERYEEAARLRDELTQARTQVNEPSAAPSANHPPARR
ncbi:MAG: excinuclease ABC subunit B [Verrucomicrobia bacterium]|nr:MAG: excinuclease ABC subunit B [Verrucomicrobiota bacterium]